MNIDEALKEIQDASYDIPFENSQFQTDKFVIASQLTPERAYRAILLRLNNRIQALNEAKYNLAREDIDLDEIAAKLNRAKSVLRTSASAEDLEAAEFAVRRLELDVAEKKERRAYTMKLVHDALTEVNHLFSCFKRFPRYTREEFEAGEREHFRLDLLRQSIGLAGAPASLIDMGEKLPPPGVAVPAPSPSKALLEILESDVKAPQITMDE